MPIDYKRYPKDWKQISNYVIKVRAKNRCEGSPDYPDCRAENGKLHPVTGSKVVLTCAHLDHDPSDCRDTGRLRAWCQRCHLTYDAPHHAHTIWKKRFENQMLFDEATILPTPAK